jgi:prolyl-tRNA synthetase
MATNVELSDNNLIQGYTSPVGQKKIKIIADNSVLSLKNFVAGANKSDHHYLNTNYPRDFTADVISDIAQAEDGFECPECAGTLKSKKGIELGHVFKLGTSFSSKLGAMYLDNEGQSKPIVMGCYGIGIGRLLAGVLEHNHDDKGILFPPEISPYQVYLCTLNHENANVAKEGELLYKALTKAKIETFFDDRTESSGVKLKDADLVGFPIRVIVSPRSIKINSAEITKRNQKESVIEPLTQAVKAIYAILDTY